jgi:HEAT repeat protein
MRVSPGDKLRTLAQLKLAPRLERLLHSAFGARVQRLGAQALRRAAARFPVLAELVGLRREMQHQVAIGSAFVTRTAIVAVDAELASPGTPLETLLARLSDDPAWQVRAGAAGELALVDDDETVAPLIRALEDPSAEVAAAAVDALSRKADARVAPALERVLENREGYFSPVTRASAVLGLGRLLGERALRPLSRALSDVDAEVSLAAIAAITEHAPGMAAGQLLPLLEDRSGYFLPFVRLSAVNGLARAGALAHHEAVRLRRNEQDDAVRSALERVVVGAFRA